MSHDPSPESARADAPAGVGWRWIGSDEPLFLRVADQIERYISGNGLRPGDRLPTERDLCELLGVSRASVREALRSLQTRGMVEVRHGKGVFVAAPDDGELALRRFSKLRDVGLDDLFAMREVLEVPAAGWAASAASDEQLATIVRTFHDLEQAVRNSAPARDLQEVDARLHLQIAEFAHNRFLAMTQTVLQEMLSRSMETTLTIEGRSATSIREHAEIVDALLARDANRARAAARRHIHSARRAAIQRIATDRAQPPSAARSPDAGG